MLVSTGADPSGLGDAAAGIIDRFLVDTFDFDPKATTGDKISRIKDTVVDLFVSGGWALSSGLAFLWSRVRILGLTILAAASGKGSISPVAIDWADTVGPIGHAGMLLLMISAVASTAGLLTIFGPSKRKPRPIDLLKAVSTRRA